MYNNENPATIKEVQYVKMPKKGGIYVDSKGPREGSKNKHTHTHTCKSRSILKQSEII